MKREPEPHYLQDTVLPKDTKRRAFNVDKEFGEGVLDRALSDLIRERGFNAPIDDLIASWNAVKYRILRDKNPPSPAMMQAAKRRLDYQTNLTPTGYVRHEVLSRILGVQIEAISSEIRKRGISDLRGEILKDVNNPDPPWNFAFEYAAIYFLATGERCWSDEQEKKLITRSIERAGQDSASLTAVAAATRLLRAHDIKFIPGKGIEIIDDPPETFEKKTEPLPEERKF